MYRHLNPRLADRYLRDRTGSARLRIHPTCRPARDYHYSFDGLTQTIAAFVDRLKLQRYALYVFDYGAPVGLRLALKYPERVLRTGVAERQCLRGGAWRCMGGPIRQYWAEPTDVHRKTVRDAILHFEGTKFQYVHGVSHPELIEPESYTLDAALLEREGQKDIQLDLFLDYASNVKLYPAFQQFFRDAASPPTLADLGQKRSVLHPPGRRGLQARYPGGRKCISSRRVTLRWKRTSSRLRRRCGTFFGRHLKG